MNPIKGNVTGGGVDSIKRFFDVRDSSANYSKAI